MLPCVLSTEGCRYTSGGVMQSDQNCGMISAVCCGVLPYVAVCCRVFSLQKAADIWGGYD